MTAWLREQGVTAVDVVGIATDHCVQHFLPAVPSVPPPASAGVACRSRPGRRSRATGPGSGGGQGGRPGRNAGHDSTAIGTPLALRVPSVPRGPSASRSQDPVSRRVEHGRGRPLGTGAGGGDRP
jgi:hypothetical protein